MVFAEYKSYAWWDLRSEQKTKIGSALSGALVSTLIGLAATNLGVLSSEAPAFSIVKEFLLPVAVPLLLYRADMRRMIKSTGALLLAFLLGSGTPFTLYANEEENGLIFL